MNNPTTPLKQTSSASDACEIQSMSTQQHFIATQMAITQQHQVTTTPSTINQI
jgi:hypothetical protein